MQAHLAQRCAKNPTTTNGYTTTTAHVQLIQHKRIQRPTSTTWSSTSQRACTQTHSLLEHTHLSPRVLASSAQYVYIILDILMCYTDDVVDFASLFASLVCALLQARVASSSSRFASHPAGVYDLPPSAHKYARSECTSGQCSISLPGSRSHVLRTRPSLVSRSFRFYFGSFGPRVFAVSRVHRSGGPVRRDVPVYSVDDTFIVQSQK